MTLTLTVTPLPDSSTLYEPSCRISEILLSLMSLFSLISTYWTRDPGFPGRSFLVAVHQPYPARREQVGELVHGLIEEPLLCIYLVLPGGTVRHLCRDRQEQQVSGSPLAHWYEP